jgi:hypothetical protein
VLDGCIMLMKIFSSHFHSTLSYRSVFDALSEAQKFLPSREVNETEALEQNANGNFFHRSKEEEEEEKNVK